MTDSSAELIEYIHTPDMGEISGFGGGYEDTCQTMLHKGVTWLMENKEADIKAKTFEGVYGILVPDSEATKALSDHITKDMDCTGAMHQAVMSRLIYIAANGWDKYVEAVRIKEEQPDDI